MSLNKFRKAEIISNFFSDHNGMELEINHKKYPEKHTKTWKLNNMLLNYQYVNNEIKEAMNRHPAATENQTTAIQYLWDTGKAILRGKFKNYKPISKKKKKKT